MATDIVKVLLVEFNSELRRELARRLDAAGFAVMEAHNGQAARIAIVKNSVDVLVVDRTLPRGEDGMDLVPQLRSDCGDGSIPAIVLGPPPSGQDLTTPSPQIRGISFVPKPVEADQLIVVIRDALRAPTEAPPLEVPRPRDSAPQAPPVAAEPERRSSRAPVIEQIDTPQKLRRPDLEASAGTTLKGLPQPSSRRQAVVSKRPALIPLGPTQWPLGQVTRFTFQRNELPREGTLAEWNIAEMFHGCFADRITGRLRFWIDSVIKVVYFSKGLPVFVDSDMPEETLGAYLVRRGTIDEAQHRELTAEMLLRGCKLGELLLTRGVMSPHDLSAAINEHLHEKVSSLFSWEDGRFALERGNQWLDGIFSFKMEPARVLLDGIRGHFSAERVAAEFPLPDEARPYLHTQTARHIPTLPLTTQEARVFRYIRREATIGEIVEGTQVPRGVVLRVLYAFFVMGLIGIEIGRPRDEAEAHDDQGRKPEIPPPPRVRSESNAQPRSRPTPHPPASNAQPRSRPTPHPPAPSTQPRSRPTPHPPAPAAPPAAPAPAPEHAEARRTPRDSEIRRGLLDREMRADYVRLMDADYFTVLGVQSSASTDEIRRAFRIRIQNLRPHMLVGATLETRTRAQELYQKVTEAYLVLEDDELRKRYLESRAKPQKAEVEQKRRNQAERKDAGSFSALLGSDVSTLWQSFFGKDKKDT
jgi:DNA-binding response OmpR family regulator